MDPAWRRQQDRNQDLIARTHYMRQQVTSEVLPLRVDLDGDQLPAELLPIFQALEIESARTAIRALSSLATIGEVDHLGGGLDLIPALAMTLAVSDYDAVEYTIEHAHTSIGYYALLASWGYLDPEIVVNEFRRGLDIAGHVSWVPGGTQLNGGRLGVMIPAAVGQALGKRARLGDEAWVITHCGDAGWISGQALNGFNGADLHRAPITFVMHRNGIQLSGSNKEIMDKDPRPIIAAMGIQIIETASVDCQQSLFTAYKEARQLAREGRPSLIYPVGIQGDDMTLEAFGKFFDISDDVQALAGKNGVALDTVIWVPGSLMSYRDATCMLECIFLVNELPGGKGHHDGHMKGRDLDQVLANPMLQLSDSHREALAQWRQKPARTVVTTARPAPGTANLVLDAAALSEVALPPVGKTTSARSGVEAGYHAVAKAFPDDVFIVSCDLDPSTKLGQARGSLAADHQFEMSIEEQASVLVANGLAVSGSRPQLNVVSTFAAFFEGIAREGFEMWKYQRNLNGVNEGLNVTYHLSHVGSCTGRDHFSGWCLDWTAMCLGYLPFVDRIYTPADAGAAFVAVKDLAARYGGHIICVPRDNLPVLDDQAGAALFTADSDWEAITAYRTNGGAQHAILAVGAPAHLAAAAATQLTADGTPTDAYIVNGFPLPDGALDSLFAKYPGGLVTVEDSVVGSRDLGLRGFAGLVCSAAYGSGLPLAHIGITDPRVAPAEGHYELWDYFGITTEALVAAVKGC